MMLKAGDMRNDELTPPATRKQPPNGNRTRDLETSLDDPLVRMVCRLFDAELIAADDVQAK
jgi:hypothetical protein